MTTILIKKKDTTGAPGTANLTNQAGGAEIAVNTYDKRIYTMNSSSAVVELGINPTSLTTSQASITVFTSGSATITNLLATSAQLTVLSGTNLTYTSGTITTLAGSSAAITNISDGSGKIRAIPSAGNAVTTAYTLAVTDVGEFVTVGASGSIVVPNDIFTSGDAITVFNNTSGNVTINLPITTAYISGTDSDRASVTLSTRGLATVLFVNSSLCVISGIVN
jgi:hypothetical protein